MLMPPEDLTWKQFALAMCAAFGVCIALVLALMFLGPVFLPHILVQ